MKKLFKVTIRETLVRTIGVKANTREEAKSKWSILRFKNKPYG